MSDNLDRVPSRAVLRELDDQEMAVVSAAGCHFTAANYNTHNDGEYDKAGYECD
jgi:hypothetical protein